MSATLPQKPPVRVRRLALVLLLQLTIGFIVPFTGLALAVVLAATWYRRQWAVTVLLLLIGVVEAYIFVSGAGWFGTRIYDFNH